jgi:deoxyribodipyrimidine photo-lyase
VDELRREFTDRDQLIGYVGSLAPWLDDHHPGEFTGGAAAAQQRLQAIEPVKYGRTRNFLDGAVTRLSPYIRHGVLTLDAVRNEALARAERPAQIEKFIQELGWRDYWQRIYRRHPERIWQDAEAYKTGFQASDYAAELPRDIAAGSTGVACIDQFISTLLQTGYLHNHARMYVAAYTVHWRRVRWQAGARWFLHHLVDGDPASNNLSWQWVASTFGGKPYIFNLDNVRKYADASINTNPADNAVLDAGYDELSARLFPRQGGQG